MAQKKKNTTAEGYEIRGECVWVVYVDITRLISVLHKACYLCSVVCRIRNSRLRVRAVAFRLTQLQWQAYTSSSINCVNCGS
jgi:hypothetical protein